MKQVILLGFYCQIYKKAPIARIYVGDVMIDEIEIPEFYTEEYIRDGQLSFLKNKSVNLPNYVTMSQTELHTMLYNKKHFLDNYWWEKAKCNHYSFEEFCSKIDPENKSKEKIKHPKLFVYIIDDKILKKLPCKLRIEIKNTDSNYVNGFMTKSTLLYLSNFYIIPYALFQDPINYTQRYSNLYNRFSTSHELQKIMSWYKDNKNIWPLSYSHYFNLINKKNTVEYVFGGDAVLEIEMKKKYGIYWPKNLLTRGFFYINRFFIKDFILELSNKYK